MQKIQNRKVNCRLCSWFRVYWPSSTPRFRGWLPYESVRPRLYCVKLGKKIYKPDRKCEAYEPKAGGKPGKPEAGPVQQTFK